MSKTLNIFNAGKREFFIGSKGDKDIVLAPKTNMDVDKSHAEKLMKMYPKEIIPAGSVVDASKDADKVAELEADHADKIADLEKAHADKVAELEAVIEAANEKIKELETELEAATKPAKK
jgi:hypothetical protein